ncbi:hypothetical protein CZ771_14460 [Actinomycetales bacterium JB111]|nr:hypothetical protein CZ771_14460 [Actinomycetales bacterium JB111]
MYERNESLKERSGWITMVVLLGSVVVAFFAFSWGSQDATAAGADEELARAAALTMAGAAVCGVVGIGAILQVLFFRQPGRAFMSAFGGVLGMILVGAAMVLVFYVYPTLLAQI